MASVFLARDRQLNRRVAVKVLHPDVGAAIGVERFRREIQVVAGLTHPGILPVLDSGESSTKDGVGRLWFTMPFVAGESLRDRLQREKTLPVDVTISMGQEIAEALEYAHQHGVVHRDVKPENILLQGNRPVLADFGIAHVIGEEPGKRLTASGITLGTPEYMSPEQALAELDIDGRSDVYALGCVMYEALTGEPPFTGRTAQAIVARMMTDLPRSISAVRQQARSVEPVVLKALSRAVADRHASAGDLAAALRATPRPSEAPVPPAYTRIAWLLGAMVVIVILSIAVWRSR